MNEVIYECRFNDPADLPRKLRLGASVADVVQFTLPSTAARTAAKWMEGGQRNDEFEALFEMFRRDTASAGDEAEKLMTNAQKMLSRARVYFLLALCSAVMSVSVFLAVGLAL